MDRAIIVLTLVAVIVVAVAVAAHQGSALVETYFDGRVEMIDAEGRRLLSEANADQLRMQTRQAMVERTALVFFAMLGALSPLAFLALWLYLSHRQGPRVIIREIYGGADPQLEGSERRVIQRPAMLRKSGAYWEALEEVRQ